MTHARYASFYRTIGFAILASVAAGSMPGQLSPPASSQTPDITAIMARVAASQDIAVAERTRYTYVQHADIASQKGHRILCHEVTDSRVTPGMHDSGQELLTLNGMLWRNSGYVRYTHLIGDTPKPGATRDVTLQGSEQIDVDLVEHLRKNLTDSKSRDGFEAGLFPLTAKAQPHYDYKLVRRESMNGRDTWHVHFKPKDKDDYNWEGDAWIDTTAYQPVLVRTRLSRGMPFLVKTMLGTNVPGLGFAVTYAPQPDGVWFPVSFGTEFKIHALFLFSRQIMMNVTNRDFQKTHTESRILDAAAE